MNLGKKVYKLRIELEIDEEFPHIEGLLNAELISVLMEPRVEALHNKHGALQTKLIVQRADEPADVAEVTWQGKGVS